MKGTLVGLEREKRRERREEGTCNWLVPLADLACLRMAMPIANGRRIMDIRQR